MKQLNFRHSLLACAALAGLAIYILACSGPSFSPDDSRVAFPAFDSQSGELGVSLLDRKSGRVETVFTLSVIDDLKKPSYEALIMRPQWLDNNRLLIAWPGVQDEEKGLNVLVLPLGGKSATRLWQIPKLGKMQETLIRPLAVAGSRLVVASDDDVTASLDLETGRVTSHATRGKDLFLLPSGREEFVFYGAQITNGANQTEFGKLSTTDFSQTALLTLDNISIEKGDPVALSVDGQQVAVVEEQGGKCEIRLAHAGQPQRTIPVATKDEHLKLGGLCFSAKGDKLFASFAMNVDTATNMACGLLEIPLNGGTAQRTVLFTVPGKNDEDSILYLQPALSRDGRTLALCSTLFFGEPEKGQKTDSGCALFLIDVSQTPHGVSKVLLPLPKEEHSFK